MIAIDTNVLLRYLLGDDKVQSAKAAKLITGNMLVLVSDIVLVETIWTLKGRKYKLDKAGILEMLNALFEEPNICFEDDHSVWCALSDYRKIIPLKSGKSLDFSDALIASKARYIAEKAGMKLKGFYTFDKAAQQLHGAKAP